MMFCRGRGNQTPRQRAQTRHRASRPGEWARLHGVHDADAPAPDRHRGSPRTGPRAVLSGRCDLGEVVPSCTSGRERERGSCSGSSRIIVSSSSGIRACTRQARTSRRSCGAGSRRRSGRFSIAQGLHRSSVDPATAPPRSSTTRTLIAGELPPLLAQATLF